MDILFSPEKLIGLLFLVLVGATAFGAIVAVTAVKLIRAVVGLLLCFIGVAGIYYFLNSPFVALMQLLIYVGAIGVVIVFAVMLAEPKPDEKFSRKNPLTGALGFLTCGTVFAGLVALALKTEWQRAPQTGGDGSVLAIGNALLTTYSMVFELISIVLLVAIIGALVLARSGREKS